jgi:hypothetical protein
MFKVDPVPARYRNRAAASDKAGGAVVAMAAVIRDAKKDTPARCE